MATFKIYYHRSGCIEVEAENAEEAKEIFSDISEKKLDDNCFCSGYEIDDIE